MRFDNPKDEQRVDTIEKFAIKTSDKLKKFSADSKARARQSVHERIYGKSKKKKKSIPLRKQLIGF
jgi:hypothetical protein